MEQSIHILTPIHKPERMTGPITCLYAVVWTPPRDSRIQLPATPQQTCLPVGLGTHLQGPILIGGHMGKSQVLQDLPMNLLSHILWRLILLEPTGVA